MSKKDTLQKYLTNADVVIIEVINSHIVDGKTGSEKIHLVSGIPENDVIISKLRDSLCK